MCGIVGYFGNHDAVFQNTSLSSLKHRGNDSFRQEISADFYLGFNRLAINDLSSRGSQPLFDSSGNVIIICNGEIFNYKTLRKKIKTRLKTSNDVEIILALYLDHNRQIESVLKQLHGMYAFCLIDKEKSKAYLVRDHMGIKPLYYYQTKNNTIYFASEVKSLLLAHDYVRTPNYYSLFRILAYRSSSSENTVFSKVHKVPAGYYLEIDLVTLKFKLKKHWEVPTYEVNLSEKEAIERTRDVLDQVVIEHLLSDVPISTTLSGGLDSSIINSILCRNKNKFESFTSFYGGIDGDEDEKADSVSRHLNLINHKILVPRDKFLATISRQIYYMDEPFADPAVYPLNFISQAIHQKNIKVCLMGEGSDEVFAGYEKYREALDGTFSVEKYINSRAPFPKDKLTKLNPKFCKIFNQEISLNTEKYQLNEKQKSKLVNNLIKFDLEQMLPNLQLMRVDKVAMSHTVEARVPFLDKRVIELSRMIDPLLQLRGNNKLILRHAYSGELPSEVVYGKKQIFFVPLDFLITPETRNHMYRDILMSDLLNEFLNLDKFELENYNNYQLWVLWLIYSWGETFLLR